MTTEESNQTLLDSALAEHRKKTAQWDAADREYVWIDRQPEWTAALSWHWQQHPPTSEVDVIYRLVLVGGGQIKLTERYRSMPPEHVLDGMSNIWLQQTDVQITAHVADVVRRWHGRIEETCPEMSQSAILFNRGTRLPAEVKERAAATLRTIQGETNNLLALLDGSEGCAICARPLRDAVSKLLHIGPECARKHRFAHSLEAASAVLERRLKLLAAAKADIAEDRE